MPTCALAQEADWKKGTYSLKSYPKAEHVAIHHSDAQQASPLRGAYTKRRWGCLAQPTQEPKGRAENAESDQMLVRMVSDALGLLQRETSGDDGVLDKPLYQLFFFDLIGACRNGELESFRRFRSALRVKWYRTTRFLCK